MEKFLAYFDILGFQEFIGNNTDQHIDLYMKNLFRESETAASGRNYIDGKPGIWLPDFSKSRIHCLHVSDTIIFWSDDITTESFKKIIECSSYFLHQIIQTRTFAVRGCIVAGNINFKPFQIKNEVGIVFYNSSLYGKPIIDAYKKAESQDWAGCYIDKSAIEKVEKDVIKRFIYENKVAYYQVPLKDGIFTYECTIRIFPHSINNVHFENLAKGIEEVFNIHMKGNKIEESVKKKMTNTIKFLNYFIENNTIEK